jgi:hypothetical protein
VSGGAKDPAARRSRTAVALAASVAIAAAASAAPARADDRIRVDDTYGRIEGDLSLLGGLGATFGPRAPRASAEIRARYLGAAGLFASYEDALGLAVTTPRRLFALGLEGRPAFLGRWLLGKETGVAFLDLVVDSVGVDLGVVFAQPSDKPLSPRPGFESGLGLEIPLFGRASGLFLTTRGGVRWSHLGLAGSTPGGADDRALYGQVGLAWQEVFMAHLVDLGDRRDP